MIRILETLVAVIMSGAIPFSFLWIAASWVEYKDKKSKKI
jgi:hypothetical protein